MPQSNPRPRPRGGRRPGAGAPRGNLNALKSGRYSKRLAALRAALDAMPLTADVLVEVRPSAAASWQTVDYLAKRGILISSGENP